VKEKCCRSTPRCAGCPARAIALARAQREHGETALLVTEILGGRPASPLPDSVAAALARFRSARALPAFAAGPQRP